MESSSLDIKQLKLFICDISNIMHKISNNIQLTQNEQKIANFIKSSLPTYMSLKNINDEASNQKENNLFDDDSEEVLPEEVTKHNELIFNNLNEISRNWYHSN